MWRIQYLCYIEKCALEKNYLALKILKFKACTHSIHINLQMKHTSALVLLRPT